MNNRMQLYKYTQFNNIEFTSSTLQISTFKLVVGSISIIRYRTASKTIQAVRSMRPLRFSLGVNQWTIFNQPTTCRRMKRALHGPLRVVMVGMEVGWSQIYSNISAGIFELDLWFVDFSGLVFDCWIPISFTMLQNSSKHINLLPSHGKYVLRI